MLVKAKPGKIVENCFYQPLAPRLAESFFVVLLLDGVDVGCVVTAAGATCVVVLVVLKLLEAAGDVVLADVAETVALIVLGDVEGLVVVNSLFEDELVGAGG